MQTKHEIITPDHLLDIKVFSFQSESADRIIYDHWHRSVEILYCVKGSLSLWMNGKYRLLKENEAVFINSNVIHASQSPEENYVIVFQVPLETLRVVSFGHYGKDTVIDYLYKEDETVNEIIREIYDNFNDKDNWRLQIYNKSLLYQLFHHFFEHYSFQIEYEHQLETNKYLEILSGVTAYIKKNHKESITLEEVAEAFNYNSEYFSRFFKRYVGITFSTYLSRVRLNTAYKLLLRSDMSTLDVALNSGFSNVKSFNKVFKEVYGETPFQYKKSKNAIN